MKDSAIDHKNYIIDSQAKEREKQRADTYDAILLKLNSLEKLKEINEITIKKLRNGWKN
jgi:hypothetical protein